jgi:hypothetical protein
MPRDYFGREIKVGDGLAIAGKVPGNFGFSPSKLLVGVVKKITPRGVVKCKVSQYGGLYSTAFSANTLIVDNKFLFSKCPWLAEK